MEPRERSTRGPSVRAPRAATTLQLALRKGRGLVDAPGGWLLNPLSPAAAPGPLRLARIERATTRASMVEKLTRISSHVAIRATARRAARSAVPPPACPAARSGPTCPSRHEPAPDAPHGRRPAPGS